MKFYTSAQVTTVRDTIKASMQHKDDRLVSLQMFLNHNFDHLSLLIMFARTADSVVQFFYRLCTLVDLSLPSISLSLDKGAIKQVTTNFYLTAKTYLLLFVHPMNKTFSLSMSLFRIQ